MRMFAAAQGATKRMQLEAPSGQTAAADGPGAETPSDDDEPPPAHHDAETEPSPTVAHGGTIVEPLDGA